MPRRSFRLEAKRVLAQREIEEKKAKENSDPDASCENTVVFIDFSKEYKIFISSRPFECFSTK